MNNNLAAITFPAQLRDSHACLRFPLQSVVVHA